MATCARFPAGSYAMEIADINHFFNQCKGNGKSATTKSLHEAGVQVICAELNTFQKGIVFLEEHMEGFYCCSRTPPHAGLAASSDHHSHADHAK